MTYITFEMEQRKKLEPSQWNLTDFDFFTVKIFNFLKFIILS